MSEGTEIDVEAYSVDRWTLIRDIVVLQFKLVIDGFRDFLLVPVSIIVGIVSLLHGGKRPGVEFYELLRFGRRSEKVINLFGAADRLPVTDEEDPGVPDIDDMVGRPEGLLVEEYRRGGITAQAKDRFDDVIDRINKAGRTDDTDAA